MPSPRSSSSSPSSSSSNQEVEIKLRVGGVREAARMLRQAGLRLKKRRRRELNWLFDTPRHGLREQGAMLRLRQSADEFLLTWKGKEKAGARHKSRPELETPVGDGRAARALIEALGFEQQFLYERYRTTYVPAAGDGEAVIDETPIGVFIELEGRARWIDETAKRLGFRRADYITRSYARLFQEYVAETGSRAREFTFAALGH